MRIKEKLICRAFHNAHCGEAYNQAALSMWKNFASVQIGRESKKRHGTGGRGQQPAPPQGASDKTSGIISTSMPSSASPGIPPELPAIHGSLPGDDETARLPSSPLVASKRPAGALSPIDVALFPAFPCTAECCLKETSHTSGAPLRKVPRQPNLRAFRPLRRALLSARGGAFISF